MRMDTALTRQDSFRNSNVRGLKSLVRAGLDPVTLDSG
jgi:hypothetical protein